MSTKGSDEVEDTMVHGAAEKWRILKNVLVVSLAFMVHFTAFQGTANLQSSINATAGLGTASLATIYVSLTLSNLFLPVVVIKWLGCKWSVALSFIAYMPYIAAQLWPSFYSLIPAALAVGLGGGPLWCAKCTYLTVIAETYSKLTGIPVEALVVRFFGVFFMIFQFAQVWGNLISSTVLSSEAPAASDVPLTNASLCGASFVPASDAAEAIVASSEQATRIIALAYLACMVLAVLLVAVALDPLTRYSKGRSGSGTGLTGFALLAITLKLVNRKKQLFIIVITTWLGLNMAFFSADFTAAYVSCALGTSYVGYVMICYGISNSLSALITGYIVKVTGRVPVVVSAAAVHGAVLVALLLWRPGGADVLPFYAVAALWGVCDGVWLVQINSFCGILFPGQEEAAYSNFRMWESLGFILAYVYSPFLPAAVKVYILFATMLAGLAGYLLVEYWHSRDQKVTTKELEQSPEGNGVCGLDNIGFNKSE